MKADGTSGRRMRVMPGKPEYPNNLHARMGATKDENKDLTDFSLRLSDSARDIFFLPQGRRGFFIFSYKPLPSINE